MGYYTRILGTADVKITVSEIENLLKPQNVKINNHSESSAELSKIDILNENGHIILSLECNPISDGSVGDEELEEFREEISDCKPASAAVWLNNFFKKVRVIYAFQHFSISFDDKNFETLEMLRTYIWEKVKGIFQADEEGFSNEEGAHILWQFSDKSSGSWNMAVIGDSGKWENFCMDLGDIEQRNSFFAGKVPHSAKRI